ncbi:hypothetical protein FKM82_024637 [Ascaphus truei]
MPHPLPGCSGKTNDITQRDLITHIARSVQPRIISDFSTRDMPAALSPVQLFFLIYLNVFDTHKTKREAGSMYKRGCKHVMLT